MNTSNPSSEEREREIAKNIQTYMDKEGRTEDKIMILLLLLLATVMLLL
jgi:hypothetical protein